MTRVGIHINEGHLLQNGNYRPRDTRSSNHENKVTGHEVANNNYVLT
jgi:hypothetical protein